MIRGALVGLLLAGCWGSRPDPELARRRQALDAWERGTAALDADTPDVAVAAFTDALEHRPGDPLLRSWRARARAADGDLDSAIDELDEVLARAPDFAEARYNRAAYLARAGRLDEAGPELHRALTEGGLDAREVLDDPDFQPHLEHPALVFLPDAPLDVALEGPGRPVFQGSEAAVTLIVRGRRLDEDLRLFGRASEGPFQLTRAVERRRAEEGEQIVEVTWYLQALGPGQSEVGPVTIRAGAREVQAGPVSLMALAPPDAEPAPGVATGLILPSHLLTGAPEPPPAPVAWRSGDMLRVRVGTAEKVDVAGVDVEPIRWRRFDGRELAWTLWTWQPAPPEATARITRGGAVLREGPVPAPGP